MVEEGLVLMIQAGLGAQSLGAVPGGFGTRLPKDLLSVSTPLAWSWKSVPPFDVDIVLGGQGSWAEWHVQIDCHAFLKELGGPGAAGAIQLARAIDNTLRGGWQGTLSDSDHTVVEGIFREPDFHDGEDDIVRSFVRSIEYAVQYYQI
jgi:hypothetical protein